jgi:hypothetical protein
MNISHVDMDYLVGARKIVHFTFIICMRLKLSCLFIKLEADTVTSLFKTDFKFKKNCFAYLVMSVLKNNNSGSFKKLILLKNCFPRTQHNLIPANVLMVLKE